MGRRGICRFCGQDIELVASQWRGVVDSDFVEITTRCSERLRRNHRPITVPTDFADLSVEEVERWLDER